MGHAAHPYGPPEDISSLDRAAVAAISERAINKHESEGLDATVPHPSWMDTFGEPLRRGAG